jgi:hypothetical protein
MAVEVLATADRRAILHGIRRPARDFGKILPIPPVIPACGAAALPPRLRHVTPNALAR